ncbi:MAG TPA: hypothetical protein VGR12_03360, partial [Solirubrobacteraceae bacterium]|nr:hypothetical protein [Solirubrobacteraceae bacterium]
MAPSGAAIVPSSRSNSIGGRGGTAGSCGGPGSSSAVCGRWTVRPRSVTSIGCIRPHAMWAAGAS